jgi:hypothetical protein
MTDLGKALARMALAGSLLVAGAVAVEAAGALAIGACGAYGFAYDYRQEGAARTAALGKCKGADCKIVTAMKRSCAALAIDGSNACGAHGYAAATRLGQAQNTALRQCYRFGGKDCVIRAFVCDAKG